MYLIQVARRINEKEEEWRFIATINSKLYEDHKHNQSVPQIEISISIRWTFIENNVIDWARDKETSNWMYKQLIGTLKR